MRGILPHTLVTLALQVAGAPDAPLPPATRGYGVQLVQSLLALLAVCVAAWWTLRWAARRGYGQAPRGRHVRVLERVTLDARRGLYLVSVGSRVFLLGASEQSLSVLAELEDGDLTAANPPAPEPAPPARSFAEVLARIRGTPAASPASSEPPHSPGGERPSPGG